MLVGNAALLRESGVALEAAVEDGGRAPVHVALDGRFAGVTCIADTLRPGAKQALAELKAIGVKRIVMLTGDNAATAQAIATELGIDAVRADLTPEDKVAAISELRGQGHRVAMVGDGINDAPALAKTDVGIAMGGAGTQAALEAADIALMTDELGKIAAARAIARPRLPHRSGEPVRRRRRGARAGHHRSLDGLERPDPGGDHSSGAGHSRVRQLGQIAEGEDQGRVGAAC